MQLVVLKCGEEKYAIDSKFVQQVIDCKREITEVPKADKRIKGIIEYRGELIPILDFNLTVGRASCNNYNNIIILKNKVDYFGIVVENVEEVIDMDFENIERSFESDVVKKGNDIITIIKDLKVFNFID